MLPRTPEHDAAALLLERFGDPPDDSAAMSFWVDDLARFIRDYARGPQPTPGGKYWWTRYANMVEQVEIHGEVDPDLGLWVGRLAEYDGDDPNGGWRLILAKHLDPV